MKHGLEANLKTEMTLVKWIPDLEHSEIKFKVKYLMMTYVSGSFKNYEISVETEENDFSKVKAIFTAGISSINTNNEKRDELLRSDEFFDSEKYPELKFVSGRIEKKNDGFFEMYGDLTIKDITQPIKLEAQFCGLAKDADGKIKAGFIVKGKINRKDFGLSFNRVSADATFLVGNEVKLRGDFQLTRM